MGDQISTTQTIADTATSGCGGTDGTSRADSGAATADQGAAPDTTGALPDTGLLVDLRPAADRKPDSTPALPKPDTSPPAPPKTDGAAPELKPDTTPPAPKPDLTPPAPKPDAAPPPPPPPPPPPTLAQLPTWVNLDWTSFPVDPGPSYAVTGKTWVVKLTGSDASAGTDAAPLRTIGAALGKAQPGDLIRVHGGSYVEATMNMAKPSVVLTAAPGETVTVTPQSGYKAGLVLTGSKVTVNGINLKGFNPSIRFGTSSATQTGVVISNLTAQAPAGVFSDGIVDYEDTNTKGFPSIKGLLLKNVKVLGASLSISCNSGPCSSWRLENVTVVGGDGSSAGSGADAIAIENGDNMLFYKVDVSGASADGIDTKATRVVVWDSHVHHVSRNGVKLWYGGDIVNTCIHNTGADAALNIKYGERVRILHSTIAFHNYGGGASYNMTFRYDDNGPVQVEIMDSIIYNTSGGAYFSNNAKVSITNSLFYGMQNGVILDFGSTQIRTSDGPTVFQTKGLGSGNLIASPGLDSDLRQQAGSITINKGLTLPSLYPVEDLEGKARVKGGLPDLGPFEEF